MLTAENSEPMAHPQESSATDANSHQEDVFALPASIAQQVFWYMELLQPGGTAFNIPMRFRLEGQVDVEILRRSFTFLVDRHETLRTTLREDQGELLQIIHPRAELHFHIHDLTHLDPSLRSQAADELGSLEARRPFVLDQLPSLRVEWVKLSDSDSILHVSIHHALFDGWSMTILTTELAAIYQAFHDHREPELPPLAIQYGDFAIWQKEFIDSPEMTRQLDYWKSQLEGLSDLELPTDRPRPATKSWKGELVSSLLPRDLTQPLQAIAAAQGSTLFHLTLAAYKVLLYHYTGSLDIAVGTPITGRTRQELEPIIGVFINSLILRDTITPDESFRNFLQRVRNTAFNAFDHQDLPFECLVRALRPERDNSRNPLFQVNFTHQRSFAKAGRFGNVTLTPIPSRSPGAIFDLHFFLVERAEGWRLTCDYSSDLFDQSTAERMLDHYQEILRRIASNPDAPIREIQPLPANEENTILLEFSGIQHFPSPPLDLVSRFRQIVTLHPQATAIRTVGHEMSYASLYQHACDLAHRLINAGVTANACVGLCALPSCETIVGMLAIVLAGACYVPIDPAEPADRIARCLHLTSAPLTLVDAAGASALENLSLHTIPLTATNPANTSAPERPCQAEDPAYVMFTSGSTGEPKAVRIPHQGITRLVVSSASLPIRHTDRFLLAAPLSFDASTLEIWAPLLNGAELVIPPSKPSLTEIAATISREKISWLWLTSGLFQAMIEDHLESLRPLRYLLAGGDVLSARHVRLALEGLPTTTLINGYGPTENTTFTTTHLIHPRDLDRSTIPIGKPIPHTTAFILDTRGNPAPIGIPGELHTGGLGLALDYLGDPALTSSRFIPLPAPLRHALGPLASLTPRLYRTGDLCKWLPDGTIEFLGRSDQQVKIRGFRIELGEVESALASHPDVRQVKAAARGNDAGSKNIVAWYIADPSSSLDPATLIDWVSHTLPPHAIPHKIARIESFPVSRNGKIDTRKLPEPSAIDLSTGTPSDPPQTPTEKQLASLWAEMLQLPVTHLHTDFFSAGGHSLLALRLFSRIHREWHLSLPLSELISHPTLHALARRIDELSQTQQPATVIAEKESVETSDPRGHLVTISPGQTAPPLICIHGGDGGAMFYRHLADFLPRELPLLAIESLELSRSTPVVESSVEETAAAYIDLLLRSIPHGPFRLAGYSFGGIVAHEMACQLTASGHQVSFLGLFDTHNPAVNPRRYHLGERAAAFWRIHENLPASQRAIALLRRLPQGIQNRRRIREEVALASSLTPEAHSHLRRVRIREENWRSMQAYQPHHFRGRITLFKARTASDKVEWPQDYGWSPFAEMGLDVVPVPGNHLSLFDSEHVPHLAQALTHHLLRE